MIYITDYVENIDIERRIAGGVPVFSYKDKNVPNQDIKALLVWHQQINADFLHRFPNVRFIQRYGVGYDQVDLNHLKKAGIMFANNPDYGVEEVAMTALAMILSIYRNTATYSAMAKKLIASKSQTWQENTISGTKRLSEQSLGIVGFGRIGQKLAALSKDIFEQIYVYDPYLRSGVEKIFNVTKVDDINCLAQVSDAISFHCPLNDETRGMINAKFIGQLESSIIINTARGELINSVDDITKGLVAGNLRGVGLDVLPMEPPSMDSLSSAFLGGEHDGRIIINPHTAYYSDSSYVEMREKAIKNCIHFIEGSRVQNTICD